MQATRLCATCGKRIPRKKRNYSSAKYCSKKCYWASRAAGRNPVWTKQDVELRDWYADKSVPDEAKQQVAERLAAEVRSKWTEGQRQARAGVVDEGYEIPVVQFGAMRHGDSFLLRQEAKHDG